MKATRRKNEKNDRIISLCKKSATPKVIFALR
jgi:hypothetical protein